MLPSAGYKTMHLQITLQVCYVKTNHNYKKILKSDWLSTGSPDFSINRQWNRTVYIMSK